MKTGKALSIIQPWAHLIAIGVKDIENRSWRTNYRGRVLVHASKKSEPSEFVDAERILRQAFVRDFSIPREEVPLGALIGHADIVGCVMQSDSPWFRGRWGFVIANAALWSRPVPCRGMPGLFDVDIDDDMRALIEEAEGEQRSNPTSDASTGGAGSPSIATSAQTTTGTAKTTPVVGATSVLRRTTSTAMPAASGERAHEQVRLDRAHRRIMRDIFGGGPS